MSPSQRRCSPTWIKTCAHKPRRRSSSTAHPPPTPAKPALLKALAEAAPESKPQITWALVALNEKSAQKAILDEYRAGHLSQVRTLDGALAFDPNALVTLIGVDEMAAMASDPSPSVRQLVATVLSRHAEAKYTDALIKLLGDSDSEISMQAAPGLGKIGDQNARAPLLEKLKGADSDSRTEYLEKRCVTASVRKASSSPSTAFRRKTAARNGTGPTRFSG